MLRNILAVIAGYALMFILVAAGLTGAYFAMGADNAFKPATYEITTTWLIVMEAIGIIAAIIGGITCAKVSKHSKGAVISLLVLVVVLGGFNVVRVAMIESPAPEDSIRSGETSNWDAMIEAGNHMPVWIAALDPVVGFVGVMLGAMIVCPCRKGDCELPTATESDSSKN